MRGEFWLLVKEEEEMKEDELIGKLVRITD
jgi:hypothetical protein